MSDSAATRLATATPPAPSSFPLIARYARQIRKNPVVAFAAVLAILIVVAALLAPFLAPFDPDAQRLLARLRPPLGFDRALPDHWLGTDQLGRDLLSRTLYGLRLTLAMAAGGACAGLLLGTVLGLMAGFLGGLIDSIVMSLADIQLSVPFMLIALLVVAVLGNNIPTLVVVLGLAYWAHFARLIRAQVLALRNLPYIEAARAAGASGIRIALRHMLPNIVSPLIVMFTLNMSGLILVESSLSFLGLGVQPPTASLGSMVGQGRDYMASAAWVAAVPSVFIAMVSFAVMMLGDWLRDHFDVTLQDR